MYRTQRAKQIFVKIREVVRDQSVVTRVSYALLTFALAVTSLSAIALIAKDSILFHTDIARDHLLMEDIVYGGRLTLLGPRTGGIPGVFHGPLWLYVNLPAFIVGGGDPAIVGWGWLVMWFTSLALTYVVALRLTRVKVYALAVVTMYALLTQSWMINFMNFSGAMLVVPLWLYGLHRYGDTRHIRYLALSYCVVGLIIQFQMALGVPLVVLTLCISLVIAWRYRLWLHLMGALTIVPFVSSFVLFDIRHDFLQIRSVLAYLFGDVTFGKTTQSFMSLLTERLAMMRVEPAKLVSFDRVTFDIPILLGGVSVGYLISRARQSHVSVWSPLIRVAILSVYVWCGFWLVTLPYKGVMWGYYFNPLLPLCVMGFVALVIGSFRRYGMVLIAVYCLFITPLHRISDSLAPVDVSKKSVGDWVYLRSRYEDIIFSPSSPKEFGYFVFTRDQLGYGPSYAMHFLTRRHPDFTPHALSKQKVTYLLAETEPHPVANKEYWTRVQVGITSEPTQVYPLSGRFVIERYDLTDKELASPTDPALDQQLLFR